MPSKLHSGNWKRTKRTDIEKGIVFNSFRKIYTLEFILRNLQYY